ncbi:MAG: hypothetical protein KQI35_11460 [Bacteroidetes bacterium]|nr:hypothetical protein [Bacteroidota bacterium]
MIRLIIAFAILLGHASCSQNKNTLKTDYLSVRFDNEGNLIELADRSSEKNFLPEGRKVPLLTIRRDQVDHLPESLKLEGDNFTLIFDDGSQAKIKVATKSTHISFELVEIDPIEGVDLIIWGPYPTTIRKSIGETVGVVRGDDFAIGLQALNPKTLGGYPWNENDCMPQVDIFENDDYSDLSEKGKRYVLYRVEAAKPEDFGSTLQAYCRNRFHSREIENWGFEKYYVPAYNDGGIIGSKIALFGCPVEQTMDVIGEIELAEGLPHPMIDGVWGKQSPAANASYLILNFGESDIEKAIGYAQQAGLKYLYHSDPFATWGHFKLNDQFPGGIDGLKECVEKAEKKGIHMGVHFLSNFITPNDPYVTPVPDKRLAKVGFSKLSLSVDAVQKEIPVESPEPFRYTESSNLQTVVIDDELVRYKEISANEPWTLLGCERGAYGTKSTAHDAGSKIGLLADHGYKVFLSNAELTKEIAINVAELFNQTGLRQISFDGIEGNRSTGMGNYGEILMATTWFDHLSDPIKSHYIADASRTSHYFWHIYSRMNWGEPWYAGFRESQTEYRFKNQAYFERNLMPGMLGWFQLTNQTSLEDIEWMLAKAAGYNAGFGFVCNYETLEVNGLTDTILSVINHWEEARLTGSFSDSLRIELKKTDREFHLERMSENKMNLYTYEIARLDMPVGNDSQTFKIQFENPYPDQPVQFILYTPDNAEISGLVISTGENYRFQLKTTIPSEYKLKYDGKDEVDLYDKNWNKVQSFQVNSDDLVVQKGNQIIEIKAALKGAADAVFKCEFKTKSDPLNLEIKK